MNSSHTRNSEFPRSECARPCPAAGPTTGVTPGRQLAGGDPAHRGGALDPAMIIGQIHSDGSNSGQAAPLVKLLYQCGSTRGGSGAGPRAAGRRRDQGLHTDGRDSSRPVVHYHIGVSRSGLLSVSVNGSALEQQLDPQWAYQGLYFKAGLYLQDKRAVQRGRAGDVQRAAR